MSDCAKCVHTYLSGNCLLGCDQKFTTIENRVVNSSLEPACPHLVLSGRVRDSNDSAKDLSDCVTDSGDNAKDINDNIFSDSKLKGVTFDLLFNLCHAFLGIAVTSAFFLILNEIPTFEYVLTSSVLFLLSAVAFRLYKRGAFHEIKGGDDL